MRFVIVTGMSGAGKSTALKMLEDMGYFCVDNLPIPLLPGFVQMLQNTDTEMKKVALGLDVRSGQDLSGLKENLEAMDRDRIGYEILFLDANDAVLVKRYKETRRQHHLSGSGRVDTGIAKEREKILFLKMKATYILDTSKMLTRELRIELEKIFVDILRLCRLGSNMGFRRMRILSLMCVFCRIRIILIHCGRRPGMRRKCRIM